MLAVAACRIMNSVRSAAAIPASSVAVLKPCGSALVSVQPLRPAVPAPWGSASLMTTTIFLVPDRQPMAPPVAGV